MANFEGTARTNYFQVKDDSAFRAWAHHHSLQVLDGPGGVALLPSVFDDGGFCLRHEEDDDSEGLDIVDAITEHLAPGSVAVVMEIGHEKMRYLSGWAVAFNDRGDRVQLSLDDIYDLALRAFGTKPTEASY